MSDKPSISQTSKYGHIINGNNNTIYGANAQPQIEKIQQQINEIQAKLDLILTALKARHK